MPTAYLFPGQGAQYPGMGADLYADFPEARARFDAANERLGFALTEVMFGAEDPDASAEALRQTNITQPALYVHSLAVMGVLEHAGRVPDMAAGHSLGEYSALAAAGAITFEHGLRVVAERGRLMAGAGTTRPGTMAAILGMENEALETLCASISEAHTPLVVQAANYNAPGQVVISGDVTAVEAAMEAAPEAGARRVIPLSVSGAFHSPLMAEARAGLAEALYALPIQPPRCPVYLNVTAKPTTDPEAIRTALLDQLTAPVRWAQTLEQMQADGADGFVEVGAGKVLSGLVKRTLGRTAATMPIGTSGDLQALLA